MSSFFVQMELDAAKRMRIEIADLREELAELRAYKEARGKQWPVMGRGEVAVGSCRNSETDIPGLIYLSLPSKREIDTDTSDIYPVGSAPIAGNILSCIYFLSGESVEQTISILREIQRNSFPEYAAPSGFTLVPDNKATPNMELAFDNGVKRALLSGYDHIEAFHVGYKDMIAASKEGGE